MITGNGLNIPIAGFANSLEGFQQADDRAVIRRSEIRKDMLELANMASEQGIQIGMDDWAQMASSQMRPGDFLASTSPSSDVLNLMKTAQNEKASRNEEDRKRNVYRAEIEDARLVETEIERRSLGGESPEEISVGLMEQYGERAKKFVPRIQGIANNASMNERIKTEQAFADTFEDEQQAADHIKTHGSGYTTAAKEGIMNAGRKAAQRREDKIHNDAITVASKVGDQLGAISESQVRTIIDAYVPPSAKPEYKQKVMEKVWGMANAAQQAKLAGAQTQAQLEAGKIWTQNAPNIAAQMATMKVAEENDLERRRQGYVTQQGARLAGTDAILKDLEDKAVKGKDKAEADVIQSVRQITSTYAIVDLDGLMDAVRTNNKAKIEAIKKVSPTRTEEQSRISAGASFLKGQPFQSQSEMLGALTPLLPPEKKFESAGAQYRDLLDAALPNYKLPPGAKVEADGRIFVPDTTGPFQSGWKEHKVQANSKELMANAAAAGTLRERMIDDLSSRVINGVQGVITDSGRINMSQEEMSAMSEQLARRYVTAFLRGGGLPTGVGKDSIDALTAEVLRNARQPVGASLRVSPVNEYVNGLQQMARDGGALPGSFVVPGSVMPSPRAQQGAPQSNQWWNPR